MINQIPEETGSRGLPMSDDGIGSWYGRPETMPDVEEPRRFTVRPENYRAIQVSSTQPCPDIPLSQGSLVSVEDGSEMVRMLQPRSRAEVLGWLGKGPLEVSALIAATPAPRLEETVFTHAVIRLGGRADARPYTIGPNTEIPAAYIINLRTNIAVPVSLSKSFNGRRVQQMDRNARFVVAIEEHGMSESTVQHAMHIIVPEGKGTIGVLLPKRFTLKERIAHHPWFRLVARSLVQGASTN